MTQANNTDFERVESSEPRPVNRASEAALAAIKSIEAAVKIATECALDIHELMIGPSETCSEQSSRRTKPPFQHMHAAEIEINIKNGRSLYFPDAVLDDGAWNILIDLFLQQERGREVSISSACAASRFPATTGLRWLDILESEAMIVRIDDLADRRRRFARLTERASKAMRQYLDWVATVRYRARSTTY